MTNFDQHRKKFIESFSGTKTFQTFPDVKDGLSKQQIRYLTRQVSVEENQYPFKHDYTEPSMKPEIITGLDKLNEMGAGIFMAINETNGKGRKASDITKVRAVFADFDGEPLPDSFDEEPSMIVESSAGKWHVYWFVDDFPLESFKIIQKAIAAKFNSDQAVNDLSRVMRVPGFYHKKSDPFMTKVVECSGLIYSYGTMVEIFPPVPVKQWSAPKYQTPKQYTSEFRGQYGANHPGRNVHLTKRIGGMIKKGLSWGEIEQEAYKEAVACNPPLSESETNNVLRSMRRYA